ncbi:MAG TPA: DUF1549 and DUF1553 domain-containing protein [Chthoniobacteraceae bacterium]|nr:DUF1549 and DUF1553 domain-containing protein [Chthoniobacteraceae bacterium]
MKVLPSLLLSVSLSLTSLAAPPDAKRPWSFAPIARPTQPVVKNNAWLKDGADLFLLSALEAKGLTPNADASRATLLRRASYDLTGLPPTPEELTAFERDPGSDDQAWARVVDRLLASPRFGERWGRHWLDVAHYADSVGRTMNAVFPYAFRYRDYVIDALNADKPYNRFVAEQIAGDLVPAKTPAERQEALIATGFLTLGAMDLTDRGEQFTMDRIDDQIDVTTRAFLGLTVSCARCHDHPSDPVSQKDYYALAGIFLSTRTWSGQVDTNGLGANGYVDEDNLVRLPAAAVAAQTASLRTPGAKGAGGQMMMEPEPTPAKGYPIEFKYRPERAMGLSEGEVQNCALRRKGDPNDTGSTPPRGVLEVPGLPKLPPIPKSASGRMQLAEWLTQPNNPLTARVMVNRIWQHLFGEGLARTVDDFGNNGEEPVNRALLDHLATRFVEGGWSVKKLIRALMLSHAYRLSSGANVAAQKVDPQNNLHWRMNPRRLELEPLRDTLLLLGGELRLDRPPGIQVAGFGGKGRNARTRSYLDENAPYRTIYLPVLRSAVNSINGVFDFPDPSQIKGQREVTTVAGQALFFLNNSFVSEMAAGGAERVLAEKAKDDAERIERAFLRVLARRPARDEVADARALLGGLTGSDRERWSIFVQALLASAEFRYVL